MEDDTGALHRKPMLFCEDINVVGTIVGVNGYQFPPRCSEELGFIGGPVLVAEEDVRSERLGRRAIEIETPLVANLFIYAMADIEIAGIEQTPIGVTVLHPTLTLEPVAEKETQLPLVCGVNEALKTYNSHRLCSATSHRALDLAFII